jgi:DNA (cytosine-5)-methyltransferase 1
MKVSLKKTGKRTTKKSPAKAISVVDLFCGIGGLSYGLKREGLHVGAGVDIDETCKFAYERNTKANFVSESVETLSGDTLRKYYSPNSIKVLAGCAPCQPFSQYTNHKQKSVDKSTPKDDKWKLLREFMRLVVELQPEIVSMENVPRLKEYPIYDEFTEALRVAGYHVQATTVYCPDYGIPQSRTRLVLLASKLGEISLVAKTHEPESYLSVSDVIGDLPPIKAGETSSDDPFHRARSLSPMNMKRIKQSRAGGTWKDWSDDLILECHKKKSGKTYGSVYGRMSWDASSPTITTHCCGLGNGRFGHPEQHRAISLREAALLQTFPKSYVFEPIGGKLTQKVLCRQIGNAVPVNLGRVIGKSIKHHVRQHRRDSSRG